MKKQLLLIVLSVFLSTSIFSQGFEGILKWKMTMPGLALPSINNQSKEMIDAKQEMMKQMNNPEIANNPAAKAMMEKALLQMNAMSSVSENGGSQTMVVKMKNGNSSTVFEGGMAVMIGEIVFNKTKNESYKINREGKTYSIIPKSKSTTNTNDKLNYKVEKTYETIKILGYNATKYIITYQENKETITSIVYATNDLKDISKESFDNMNEENNAMYLAMKKIEGIPLKIVSKNQGMEMTMECIEIKKTYIPQSDFEIPAGFVKSKY